MWNAKFRLYLRTRLKLFGSRDAAVVFDALRAGAIGFQPLGVVLLDTGDYQAVPKALIIEGGVRAQFAYGHGLAAEGTLELPLFGGALLLSAQQIAQMFVPDAHRALRGNGCCSTIIFEATSLQPVPQKMQRPPLL